jgi:hypothetical protein
MVARTSMECGPHAFDARQRRAPRARRRSAAIVMVGLVCSALLASGCSFIDRGPAVTEKTIGSSGGDLASSSGKVTVSVPSGSTSSDVHLKVSEGGDGPSASPQDPVIALAVPVGDPVQVTTTGDVPGTKVEFAFNPASDLKVRDATATVQNAFIAIYNDALGTWVPLQTTYDASSHRLVATAPHFSWLQKYVLDPIKTGYTKVETGVDALIARMMDNYVGPERETISCPNATDEWTATANDDAITACVEPGTGGGPALLRIQNNLLLGYAARPPGGLGIGFSNYDATGNELGPLIMRGLYGLTGALEVPAWGAGEISIPATYSGTGFVVPLHPDGLGLAIDTIITLLGWIPEFKSFKEALLSPEGRKTIVELSGKGLSHAEFWQQLRQRLFENVTKPETLDMAAVASDAFSCMAEGETGGLKSNPDATLTALGAPIRPA